MSCVGDLSGKVVECLELARKTKWTRNMEPIRKPLADSRGSVRRTIILQVLHCFLELKGGGEEIGVERAHTPRSIEVLCCPIVTR